jgi:hypothetical protein
MASRPFHYKRLKYIPNSNAEYREYRVNAGNGNDGYSDLYIDILDKIINHLEAERLRYKALFVGRFDMGFSDEIKQPDIEEQQEIVATFLNKVKSHLVKKTVDKSLPLRNHEPVKIGWSREYGRDKHWHYHCYICLDGGKIDSWNPDLYNLLDYHWEKVTKNHYKPIHINNPKDFPVNVRARKKNHWLIKKNDAGEKKFCDSIYALSYLAKCRDKRDGRLKFIASHSIPKITVTSNGVLIRNIKQKVSELDVNQDRTGWRDDSQDLKQQYERTT